MISGILARSLMILGAVVGLAACTNSTAPVVATVQVTLAASSVEVGKTTKATATALDASGKTISGITFTWSSNNTAVATVGADGTVTGVAAGTANIIATSNSGNKSGSATVTVTTPAPVISTIQVTSPANPVQVGGLSQLVATALDASNQPIPNTTFTWNSDNTAVATVDTNGVVTGVSAGTANITASSGGKTSANVAVTVVAATAPAPGTISGTVTLPPGGKYNGEGSVTACFVESVPPTPACNEGSPNNKLVPLNSDGTYTITGLAAGSYIIRAGQNNVGSGGLFQPGNYFSAYPNKDNPTPVTVPANNINFQFQVLSASAAAKLKSQYPSYK